MLIDSFKIIDSIIGHTDISASESYDNKSYKNMIRKINIIYGFISELEDNLLYEGCEDYYSVKKLKKQARDNLKEISDFCLYILEEEDKLCQMNKKKQ